MEIIPIFFRGYPTYKFKLSGWFCFSRPPWGPWGSQNSGMKPKSADSVTVWKLSQRSFFGRIEDTIICFRDCLTFILNCSRLIISQPLNLDQFMMENKLSSIGNPVWSLQYLFVIRHLPGTPLSTCLRIPFSCPNLQASISLVEISIHGG